MRRRRWREYQTESGARPIRDVVDTMTDEEAADLAEAMKEVLHEGLCAARHLRGEIFEIRAGGSTRSFRLLFAPEGRHKQVLLALSVFSKTTQREGVRNSVYGLEQRVDAAASGVVSFIPDGPRSGWRAACGPSSSLGGHGPKWPSRS